MPKIDRNYAIGVFDSGLGGLTVVKELMRQLPQEDIVYYGDTARVPYGTKSKESIIRFSKENTEILLKHNVKMIIVACNSSSSYALGELKKNFDLPILGVLYPGARQAALSTKNFKVGVIATSATIASQRYIKVLKQLNPAIEVFSQPCPLFVPLVEEGWLDRNITRQIASEYLACLKKAEIDTLIMGCTHYPLLRNTLQQVMGKQVILIDSARALAEEVKNLLQRSQTAKVKRARAKYKFLISDKPQEFKKIAKNFLGYDIKKVIKV